MSIALTALLLALPPQPQDRLLEEHLIGTVPEAVSLDGGLQVAPDGSSWPIVHRVVFGPRGERVAFVGVQDGATHPVIGDQVFESYDFISTPRFDASGETVIFRVGRRKSKTTEVWWVLVNGEEIGKEDWIGQPSISSSGERIAYWTQPGAKVTKEGPYNRGDQVLVVAQKSGKKWKTKKGGKWDDARSLNAPIFSADGKKVTVLAQNDREWFVVQRGTKEKELTPGEVMITDFVIDESGKSVAYSAVDMGTGGLRGAKGLMANGMRNHVIWGKLALGSKFDSAFAPVLSLDGKRLAFKVLMKDKMGVVGEGSDSPPETFEYVHKPILSPDGKTIAYVVTEGGELNDFLRRSPYGDDMIKGGERFLVIQRPGTSRESAPLHKGAKWLSLRDPVLSENGEHSAYAARSEKGWTIVVDEVPGQFYEEVGAPTFVDAKHVVHGSRQGRELWWRVREVDGGSETDDRE